MVSNDQLIFEKTPREYPIPGETLRKVTSEFDQSQSAPQGGLVTKTAYLSLDPYLRGRMRDGGDSYVPAFEKGKPIVNFGVSKVLSSSAEGFKEGDYVYGQTAFAQYNVWSVEQAKGLMLVKNEYDLPLSYFVGALGMPAQTAFFGLNSIVKPQKGETIFVSAGSGAVGQMVIALAHIAGMRVIASAGSDEKVEALRKDLGVEVAFNYKTQDSREILEKEKYHAFWDNVGGKTLEDVFATIQPRGRIVECGQASVYNDPTGGHAIRNTFNIIAKSLKVQGFIVLTEDTTGFYDVVPKLVHEGKVPTPKEHKVNGLDNGEAFTALLKGESHGKVLYTFDE